MIIQTTTTMTNNKIELPKDVYRELEIVRESGKVNMITEVKRGLEIMNYDTALNWVNNNPEKYSKGVFTGFTPIDNNE